MNRKSLYRSDIDISCVFLSRERSKRGVTMKAVILIVVLMLCNGCSLLTGPKETEKFTLKASGGYRGTPVGNCSMSSADEECGKLGWDGADDFTCGSVHVSGGFFGSFDQDVMYTVTCYRN